MYLVDVESEQFGRDLRRDRVGAGTEVGGRAADVRGAVAADRHTSPAKCPAPRGTYARPPPTRPPPSPRAARGGVRGGGRGPPRARRPCGGAAEPHPWRCLRRVAD